MQVGWLITIAFFNFWAQKCKFFAPVSPRVKFCLFSHWNMMLRLTIDMSFDLLPIYDPFKSQMKWRQMYKFWLWHQFYHRTIIHRKICNAPFDAPMCPLQIIIWHWTSITDPSWLHCKHMLYPSTIPQRKSKNFEFDVNFFKEWSIAKNLKCAF